MRKVSYIHKTTAFPDDEETQKLLEACNEIMARDRWSWNKLVYISLLEFTKKHGVSKPNPQQTLLKTIGKPKVTQKCQHPRCTRDAVYLDYAKPPGNAKVYSCQFHHDKAVENRLLKGFKLLQK